MRQAVQSTKLMQAIIIALIAGGVIFWVGAEMGKPAGRKDLKVEVTELLKGELERLAIACW